MTFEQEKNVSLLKARAGSILVDRQDEFLKLAQKINNAELTEKLNEVVGLMQAAYEEVLDCLQRLSNSTKKPSQSSPKK